MIKQLRQLLKQVHEPDEYLLEPHNLTHGLYWVWKLPNARLKDLDLLLRPLRPEHARFDIFINGQFIVEEDYFYEQIGRDIYINFKRANFDYEIESTDEIKIEGDIDRE